MIGSNIDRSREEPIFCLLLKRPHAIAQGYILLHIRKMLLLKVLECIISVFLSVCLLKYFFYQPGAELLCTRDSGLQPPWPVQLVLLLLPVYTTQVRPLCRPHWSDQWSVCTETQTGEGHAQLSSADKTRSNNKCIIEICNHSAEVI